MSLLAMSLPTSSRPRCILSLHEITSRLHLALLTSFSFFPLPFWCWCCADGVEESARAGHHTACSLLGSGDVLHLLPYPGERAQPVLACMIKWCRDMWILHVQRYQSAHHFDNYTAGWSTAGCMTCRSKRERFQTTRERSIVCRERMSDLMKN